MQTLFTARRFRARAEIKEHALEAVKKLDKFYDGIVKASIILSFEGAAKNIKIAEVNLHVHGVLLSAKEKSDDYRKSMDLVVEKLASQLAKYKTKSRMKDKGLVRSLKEKS
ncbi:MAG: ribosome-associated translation inhibitor RaiA [Ignavibacteria bacterium]|nr:ribosome-associated translation inhibitor RaiA [Ignavibacteria bacterium]